VLLRCAGRAEVVEDREYWREDCCGEASMPSATAAVLGAGVVGRRGFGRCLAARPRIFFGKGLSH